MYTPRRARPRTGIEQPRDTTASSFARRDIDDELQATRAGVHVTCTHDSVCAAPAITEIAIHRCCRVDRRLKSLRALRANDCRPSLEEPRSSRIAIAQSATKGAPGRFIRRCLLSVIDTGEGTGEPVAIEYLNERIRTYARQVGSQRPLRDPLVALVAGRPYTDCGYVPFHRKRHHPKLLHNIARNPPEMLHEAVGVSAAAKECERLLHRAS